MIQVIAIIAGTVFVVGLLGLITRPFMCWYLKIDERKAQNAEIIEQLKKLNAK